MGYFTKPTKRKRNMKIESTTEDGLQKIQIIPKKKWMELDKEYVEGNLVNFCSFPRAGSHWVLDMLNKCTVGIFDTKKGGWRGKIHKSHALHMFKNPTVYLYRHGKDAILSFAKMQHYKLAVTRKTYNKSFDSNFLRWIILRNQIPLHWKIHMDHYFQLSNTKICYIKYEDVLLNPVKALKTIMMFYGMDAKALKEDLVDSELGMIPSQKYAFEGAGGVEGYPPQLGYVKRGWSPPEERLEMFTERWKTAPEWTEEVDMMVNYRIKDALIKYGYLP